jgi:hypothetical protein
MLIFDLILLDGTSAAEPHPSFINRALNILDGKKKVQIVEESF